MNALENLLLIDIETVSGVSSYNSLDEKMQHLWDKKSYQIEKDSPNPAMVFSEKAGIYAEFGKIICIGLGYFTKIQDQWHLKVKSLFGDNEKQLLLHFNEVCNRFFNAPNKQFCGHNIREFDIPYICRRSLINSMPLPHILVDLQNKKPWENPMLDTLQLWKFGEYKNFTSVELLANILDIESPKSDIDGSQVGKVFWEERNLQRIASYCNRDVVTVAQILMRLHTLPLIPEAHIHFLEDIEANIPT